MTRRLQTVNPKVSILIPTFNREELIGECIQSTLNQTFTDFEIIVVDNASVDRTWQICQEFAACDCRVHIFRNETNIGPVRNWKRCIDEAQGTYGKLLFSDDLIEPDFLRKTVPFLAEQDVGFVFTSVAMGCDPGKGTVRCDFADETRIYAASAFINAQLFGGDVPISPGCAIFRLADLKKNLMLNIPSPSIKDFPAHGAGPDLLLYLLTAKTYDSVAYINEALSFFREHEGSISVSDKNQYLCRCYLQAKIWFAEGYFNKRMLDNYYANTWYQFSLRAGRWARPSVFLSDYSSNLNVCTFMTIVKFLAMKLMSKARSNSKAP